MSGTTNYSWPLIAESQTQKYQTHNDALQDIDTKVHALETAIGGGAAVTSVAGRTGAVTLAVADVSGAAPLASPALTGTPTAPTAAAGTNSTQLATTAYVDAAAAAGGAVASVAGRTGAVTLSTTDVSGLGTAATKAASGSGGTVASVTGSFTVGHLAVFADTSGTVSDGGPVSGAGSGTVTSVAMTVPSELSISGSPITTSGTLALTWATEAANKVFAGPSSGSAAAPTFRSLVDADMPSRPYDIAVFAESTLTASEVILRWVAPRAISIASGTSGNAIAGAASTGTAVLNVAKNGTGFGTVTFSSSATGTVSITSTTALAAGDVLTITGPSAANASLADVAISLAATRT